MSRVCCTLLIVATAACTTDGTGGTGPGPNEVVLSAQGGDGQSGLPSTVLTNPLRVRLVRGTQPQEGQTVTWLVAEGDGTLNTSSTTTDASGHTQVVLTLGADVGVTTVTASVSGATGSPVTFSAFALVEGQAALVEVLNNFFQPAAVTIQRNGVVIFNYPSSSQQHNILPTGGAVPNSPTVRNGPFVYEATFPLTGTFGFYCSVHGTSTTGMRGTVVVQ